MVVTDNTNIVASGSERSLSGELVEIYAHGLTQKAFLQRIMALSDASPDSSNIYNVFVNGANGQSSLYEDLSVVYDVTYYNFDRDNDYKTDHADLMPLLEAIKKFIDDIAGSKLPKTTMTAKTGMTHFDRITRHIRQKGLIKL